MIKLKKKIFKSLSKSYIELLEEKQQSGQTKKISKKVFEETAKAINDNNYNPTAILQETPELDKALDRDRENQEIKNQL